MEKNIKECMFCSETHDKIHLKRLRCSTCQNYVHSNCVRRGSVPGGLVGDIFFDFTCLECSADGSEQFIRQKMSWLQTVSLVLYHMQHRCQGLSKRGYFHWKTHIVTFISKNWNVLFQKDVSPKKNWTGTIAGMLSHYSPQFFTSGTPALNELGWWTLTYPKLTPALILELNLEILSEKHKYKGTPTQTNEITILKNILETKSYVTEEMLNTTSNNINLLLPINQTHVARNEFFSKLVEPQRCHYSKKNRDCVLRKQKPLLPTIENIIGIHKRQLNKLKKQRRSLLISQKRRKQKIMANFRNGSKLPDKMEHIEKEPSNSKLQEPLTASSMFYDYQYYYFTCMQNLENVQNIDIKTRLVGHITKGNVVSPYSFMSFPPYIWQATTINPPWLQLMDEVQAYTSYKKYGEYKLVTRSTLDFMYLQPDHLAAINTLCAHYFWSGIDVSDALEYPDYTCVVLYKKLIVGFAIVVPNISLVENYLSFIFTLPAWRNCGIAKFMLYFVTQASANRDITLHVSISNNALFLYQKFGFKVERVILDFYDKFLREDSKESRNAFFCRLER